MWILSTAQVIIGGIVLLAIGLWVGVALMFALAVSSDRERCSSKSSSGESQRGSVSFLA